MAKKPFIIGGEYETDNTGDFGMLFKLNSTGRTDPTLASDIKKRYVALEDIEKTLHNNRESLYKNHHIETSSTRRFKILGLDTLKTIHGAEIFKILIYSKVDKEGMVLFTTENEIGKYSREINN